MMRQHPWQFRRCGFGIAPLPVPVPAGRSQVVQRPPPALTEVPTQGCATRGRCLDVPRLLQLSPLNPACTARPCRLVRTCGPRQTPTADASSCTHEPKQTVGRKIDHRASESAAAVSPDHKRTFILKQVIRIKFTAGIGELQILPSVQQSYHLSALAPVGTASRSLCEVLQFEPLQFHMTSCHFAVRTEGTGQRGNSECGNPLPHIGSSSPCEIPRRRLPELSRLNHAKKHGHVLLFDKRTDYGIVFAWNQLLSLLAYTRAYPAPAMEPARGAANGCCGSLRAVTCTMTVGWT